MAANRMLRSCFQKDKKYKLGRLQIQWVGNIGLRPSLIFFGTDMALAVFFRSLPFICIVSRVFASCAKSDGCNALEIKKILS